MPNGCMSTGGSALNWFARTFAGGEAEAREGWPHAPSVARPARRARPAGSDGLSCLPYFLGEKTPIHDPARAATFDGLTLSHDIGHLWRALLEAYAYAIVHHVEVLNDIGHPTERFIVSDGGSASQVWMQIVADVLQRPLAAACRPSRLLRRRRLDGGDRRRPRHRLVGGFRLRAAADRIEPRPESAETYRRGYRRYREIYRSLAEAARHERLARGRLGYRRHADRQRGPAPSLVDRDLRGLRPRSLRSSRRGLPRHPYARRLDCARAAYPRYRPE